MTKRITLIAILAMVVAVAAGCGQQTATPPVSVTPPELTATAEPSGPALSETANTPAAGQSGIIKSRPDGYYMSGSTIIFNNMKIYSLPPNGTGVFETSMYKSDLDGKNEVLLTENLDPWSHFYLSGGALYFTYCNEDAGTRETCRLYPVDGAPEMLGTQLICATENYFYYFKGEDAETVFRADANMKNEKPMPGINAETWNRQASADLLFFLEEDYDNQQKTLVIYSEDGAVLHKIDIDYICNEGLEYNGIYYWCRPDGTFDEPADGGVIKAFDINTGKPLTDIAARVAGMPAQVQKIEDGYIYITCNVSLEVDPQNTHLYKVPLDGQSEDAVFVDKWYES